MVLFGVEFENPVYWLDRSDLELRKNSLKDFAQTVFTVRTSRLDSNVLIIHKEFVADKVMKYIYLFLLIGSCLPLLIWGVTSPMIVVLCLTLLWSFLNTSFMNFLMFKLMVKKLGYKDKLRLL